jgi:hypothetical protein
LLGISTNPLTASASLSAAFELTIVETTAPSWLLGVGLVLIAPCLMVELRSHCDDTAIRNASKSPLWCLSHMHFGFQKVPLLVLAAKAAIHDNGLRAQCEWLGWNSLQMRIFSASPKG